MTRIGKDEAERLNDGGDKPRPKGSLPYLADDLDVEGLRDWLSLALRPPSGWRMQNFERTGRQKSDPCWLTLNNGRERLQYRFDNQRDLFSAPRVAVTAVTDGLLRIPHLTKSEVEDFWVALCRLGSVLTETDDRHETGKWLEQLIEATSPLRGYTLVPDHRHDALMAIRAQGEFAKVDALATLHGHTENGWQRRPVRFIDERTGEQFVRAAEAITFVRYVGGAEPLSPGTFRARCSEIGVHPHLYEDYRPPHPKATLYRLSDALIEFAEASR